MRDCLAAVKSSFPMFLILLDARPIGWHCQPFCGCFLAVPYGVQCLTITKCYPWARPNEVPQKPHIAGCAAFRHAPDCHVGVGYERFNKSTASQQTWSTPKIKRRLQWPHLLQSMWLDRATVPFSTRDHQIHQNSQIPPKFTAFHRFIGSESCWRFVFKRLRLGTRVALRDSVQMVRTSVHREQETNEHHR